MIPNPVRRLALLAGLLALTTRSGHAQGPDPAPETSVGTAFTYQGRVEQGGTAVNGMCDFRFTLYDSLILREARAVAAPVTMAAVPVANGLFTVQLDFGDGVFTGSSRALQVAVGCPSPSASFTPLSPLQSLTAAPNALHARVAGSAYGLQGRPVGKATPSSGQVLKWDGSAWVPGADAGGISYAGAEGVAITGGTIKLADGGVTSAKLADGGVTSAKLADGGVTSAKLVDGGITSAKLADSGVTAAKLAPGAVTSGKLAPASVDATKMADAAVTGPKLAANAVDGAKIADGGVKAADVDSSQVQRRVAGTCPAGQFATRVNADGSLVCATPSGGGAAGWALTGNASTNPATQYVGTTDSQPLVVRTVGVERLRVGTTGNVGIGTSNPAARLEIAGGNLALNDGMVRLRTGTDVNHGLQYDATIDGMRLSGYGGFRWQTSAGAPGVLIERMRMDSGGHLGLWRMPDPAYVLDVNGVARVTNLVTSSDARLKDDIAPLAGALDRIATLNGVSFTWRSGADATGHPAGARDIGLIGQEVAAAYPELVVRSAGPEGYLAVDYSRLSAVLVAATNELRARHGAELDGLKAAGARLDAENTALLARQDRLAAENAALHARQDRLAAENAALRGQLAALRARTDDLAAAQAALAARLEGLDSTTAAGR